MKNLEELEEPYMSDVLVIEKYNLLYGDDEKTVIDVSYNVDGYVTEVKFQCCYCYRTWWQKI